MTNYIRMMSLLLIISFYLINKIIIIYGKLFNNKHIVNDLKDILRKMGNLYNNKE